MRARGIAFITSVIGLAASFLIWVRLHGDERIGA
jgi:hypothetical protein